MDSAKSSSTIQFFVYIIENPFTTLLKTYLYVLFVN